VSIRSSADTGDGAQPEREGLAGAGRRAPAYVAAIEGVANCEGLDFVRRELTRYLRSR
jgi:hypothetical protein